jgi:hypothetical protein
VVVPDLRPLIDAPSFHAAACAAAVRAAGRPDVIVGHSRAGAYLPGIATAAGNDRVQVLFVDARLPSPGRSWAGSLSPERLAWLRSIVRDGRLPTWDTWLPAHAMAELLPDPAQRDRVLSELPRLPWPLVEEVLPTPGRAWHRARRGYLQLSAAYQAEADTARTTGYRVRRDDADHLAVLTRPDVVAASLLKLLAPI